MKGAVMLPIPKAVMESLSLAPDMLVSLSVANGRLTIEARRPRYRLADLVQQCDRSAGMAEEDNLWCAAAASPVEA